MKEKIKILHLEDNDTDAELINSMLKYGGIDAEITRANNKETYLACIDNKDYDLVISDYSLPQFDGLRALMEAKKRDKYIPFIFCSGTIGEERAVQCLQLGAMDYVIKDRLDKLVPAISRALRLITEIKEKEKVEAELKKIRAAIENTSETIFVTNSEHIIQYVNPAFTTMYGWFAEEIVGKHTPDILRSNQYDESFYGTIIDSFSSGSPFSFEMINKTKEGKLIEIKSMTSPIVNNNVLTGFVYIQTDISLKKLHEQELLKAKNEAEEMSRLKSYFLSNISHEMRTPLISILGFSEVLKNELQDVEYIEAAKYIYDSGIRLQKTINGILSLQDIELEKIELINENINLIKLLEEVIERYRAEATKKSLLFNIFFECEEALLRTDKFLLIKVFSNVLDNAVKFTKQGEITINLSKRTEKDNLFAIVKIKDTGIGISDDKIDHILGAFRQESEGADRVYEGMGLGLYIAKQILDLLHGEIKIESQTGHGTQVEIILPIVEQEIRHKKEVSKLSPSDLNQTSEYGKPRVLLVEDNEGNRVIFSRYLRDDFIISDAGDGLSGISKAESEKYDLILMDINLGPGIDGIETCYRIRKIPYYEKIPIIALTAFGAESEKQKFLDYGFTDYLLKPVAREDLISVIKQLVPFHGSNSL